MEHSPLSPPSAAAAAAAAAPTASRENGGASRFPWARHKKRELPNTERELIYFALQERSTSRGVLPRGTKSEVARQFEVHASTVNAIWRRGQESCITTDSGDIARDNKTMYDCLKRPSNATTVNVQSRKSFRRRKTIYHPQEFAALLALQPPCISLRELSRRTGASLTTIRKFMSTLEPNPILMSTATFDPNHILMSTATFEPNHIHQSTASNFPNECTSVMFQNQQLEGAFLPVVIHDPLHSEAIDDSFSYHHEYDFPMDAFPLLNDSLRSSSQSFSVEFHEDSTMSMGALDSRACSGDTSSVDSFVLRRAENRCVI